MYTMGFDIGAFFSNLTDKAKTWGAYFIMFLGVVLLIMGVVNIVKAFASHGRGQVNWLMVAGMILVGGFLLGVGANMEGLINLSKVGEETIKDLGDSSGGGGGGGT